MPKITEILKKRWPEAAVVIVFYAGMAFLMDQLTVMLEDIQSQESTIVVPEGRAFLLATGFMAFAVIGLILHLGFIATSFTEGTKNQEIAALLKTGRYYFWRIIRFQIILGCSSILVLLLVASLLTSFMSGPGRPEDISSFHAKLAYGITILILLKPILLIPPIIIIYDCNVIESFRYMQRYKMLKARELLLIMAVVVMITIVLPLIVKINTLTGISGYTVNAVFNIVGSTFSLALWLAAMRFIASKAEVTPVAKDAEEGEDT